tara:strand:+ start:2612 stop:2887 length:276 start_codon:yes stop_codon:yes gene_type:complete
MISQTMREVHRSRKQRVKRMMNKLTDLRLEIMEADLVDDKRFHMEDFTFVEGLISLVEQGGKPTVFYLDHCNHLWGVYKHNKWLKKIRETY